MPRLLIIDADDFGVSRGVNAGIVESHANGVVTSTSLVAAAGGELVSYRDWRSLADGP